MESRVQKAREAVECARDMLDAAETKFVEAVAGVERAKDAQAVSLTKAAKSGAMPKPDSAARNARVALQNAEDAREAATRALSTCEAALVESEYELKCAQDPIAKCVDAVLRTECAARVLKEVRILQEKLIVARVALQFLERRKLLPGEFAAEAKSILAFREFPSWFGNVEFVMWEKHEEGLRWAELHKALSKDADAEL